MFRQPHTISSPTQHKHGMRVVLRMSGRSRPCFKAILIAPSHSKFTSAPNPHQSQKTATTQPPHLRKEVAPQPPKQNKGPFAGIVAAFHKWMCFHWMSLAVYGQAKMLAALAVKYPAVLVVAQQTSSLDPTVLAAALHGLGVCDVFQVTDKANDCSSPLLKPIELPVKDQYNGVDADAIRKVVGFRQRRPGAVLLMSEQPGRDGSSARVTEMAAQLGWPVVPMCCEGTQHALPRHALIPRPKRVAVEIGTALLPPQAICPDRERSWSVTLNLYNVALKNAVRTNMLALQRKCRDAHKWENKAAPRNIIMKSFRSLWGTCTCLLASCVLLPLLLLDTLVLSPWRVVMSLIPSQQE